MRYFKLFVILLFVSNPCIAGMLERAIGPTYPISERDAAEMIVAKLKDKERSGELEKIKQAAIARSLNSIKNPPAVPGIQKSVLRATHYFDPTVSYPNGFKTETGDMVAPPGASINPLNIITLTKRYLFIDGADKEQIAAAERAQRAFNNLRVVLVNGSWFDLTKRWKHQVFFDQKGTLSSRFGIKSVPSLVQQEGKLIRVDQIPAREFK